MISNVVFAVSNLTHSWSPAYKWAAVSPGSRLAFSCFKKTVRGQKTNGEDFFQVQVEPQSGRERWKHCGLLAFTCFLMDAAVRELWPERSERLGEADRQKEVSGSQTVRTPGDQELRLTDPEAACSPSEALEWHDVLWTILISLFIYSFKLNFNAFSVEELELTDWWVPLLGHNSSSHCTQSNTKWPTSKLFISLFMPSTQSQHTKLLQQPTESHI